VKRADDQQMAEAWRAGSTTLTERLACAGKIDILVCGLTDLPTTGEQVHVLRTTSAPRTMSAWSEDRDASCLGDPGSSGEAADDAADPL
jgi:hypothetical protein